MANRKGSVTETIFHRFKNGSSKGGLSCSFVAGRFALSGRCRPPCLKDLFQIELHDRHIHSWHAVQFIMTSKSTTEQRTITEFRHLVEKY
jgi:hypothetical protein